MGSLWGEVEPGASAPRGGPQLAAERADPSAPWFSAVSYGSSGSRWNAFAAPGDGAQELGLAGDRSASGGAPSLWGDCAPAAKAQKRKRKKPPKEPPSFFQEGTGLPSPAKAVPAARAGVWTGPTAPRARGQRTLHDLMQPGARSSASVRVARGGSSVDGSSGRSSRAVSSTEAGSVLARIESFRSDHLRDDAAAGSAAAAAPKAKRRPSAYQLFAKELRAELKRQEPSLAFGAVSQRIGESWRAISTQDRQRYEELAQTGCDVVQDAARRPLSHSAVNRSTSASVALGATHRGTTKTKQRALAAEAALTDVKTSQQQKRKNKKKQRAVVAEAALTDGMAAREAVGSAASLLDPTRDAAGTSTFDAAISKAMRESQTVMFGLVYCQPGGIMTSFTMSANQAQQSLTSRVCGLGISVLEMPEAAREDTSSPVVQAAFYIPTIDVRSVDEEASMRQQHCLSGVVAVLQSKCVSVSWDVQTSCRHLSTLMPHLYPTDLFDPKIAIWVRDSESKVVMQFDEACDAHGLDARIQQDEPQQQSLAGLSHQLRCFANDLRRCGMLAMELFDRLTSGTPAVCGKELRRSAEDPLCLDKCVPCEMATAALLGKMEACGILVDVEYLQRCIPVIKQRLYELEAEAHSLAGHAFLLTSPQQISAVLYDELNLKPRDQPSQQAAGSTVTKTSEAILLELQSQHPLPAIILQHRSINKLLSTYVEPFLQKCSASADGRLRSSFLQLNTVTGRLASKNPNLQNLPRESTTLSGNSDSSETSTINIRRALKAAPGCVFVASDFCQLEVRILAHFCEDDRLQRFLCDGGDPFTSLASDWLSIPAQSVSETERAKAKQCVYGIVYGMGPGLLAQKLGLTLRESSTLMRSFSARYPLVKRWEHQTLSHARACSASHTLFRRRRHLPDLHSKIGARKAAAERQAINSVIQGTASDIMKQAMMKAEERLAQLQLDPSAIGGGGTVCRCVLQVHDELVYEVSQEWASDVGSEVTAAMEGCVELSVPLRVSTKIGPTLGDLR